MHYLSNACHDHGLAFNKIIGSFVLEKKKKRKENIYFKEMNEWLGPAWKAFIQVMKRGMEMQ